MIRCAIEALGEGSGSTVQSISDYIKAQFHGLPPAHNRLIVFYLNQLIESGDFAVGGAPDRYVVVSNSPSPPAPCARYSSPESVSAKLSSNLMLALHCIALHVHYISFIPILVFR